MSLLSHALKLPSSTSSLEELEPFSNIQLVVLDLDGTLLKKSDSLPGELISYLKNSNNIKLTIATGRTLKGASKILDKLNLSNKILSTTLSSFAVVLYNGSLVINPKNNAIIYHNEIPISSVNKIIDITIKYAANTFIYIINSSGIMATGNMESVYYIGSSQIPKFDFNGMNVEPWDSEVNQAATALLIVPNDNNKDILFNELEQIKDISVTSSGGTYIEIKPQNSSKANGLQHWINLPKVEYKQEEILAVGDNDNDVEMLKWAGIGVAVKSASQAAIEASDYVTQFGAEQGVIEVLTLLKQVNRYKNIQRHFK